MCDTITPQQYQALHQGKDRSSVERKPDEEGRAAKVRAHLRAMGDYYDIPRERTESYIKAIDYYSPSDSIADELRCFADTIGIPAGPASFYIRQQELSEKI